MALGHLGDNMKKVEQINQLQENNKVHSTSISGKQGLHSKEKSYVSVFSECVILLKARAHFKTFN